jgi:hypothetical protein
MSRISWFGVVALSVGLVACNALPFLPAAPLPDEVTQALDRSGLVGRPAAPPGDIVAPQEVMAAARHRVAGDPAQPLYVEVTCKQPPKCITWIGFAAGQTAGVWVVMFPGVDGANGPPDKAYVIFDAKTGQFQIGDWP